ncbi:MAG: hypothetical protein SFU83_03735 [Meiothermus sp.]|nr:hypothetical protein [Meiothermus sp.]
MNYLVSTMLLALAFIHLLPLVGVLGGEPLSRLYGLRFEEPNLSILMRHRAVLFGLLGAFLALSAFQPSMYAIGLIAAFVSVASFVLLAQLEGGYNSHIRTVLWVDLAGLACVAIGGIALLYSQR